MGYRLVAWNVDGYSQEIHDWLEKYLNEHGPDLVFLSETKQPESVLREYFNRLRHYQYLINSHLPSRYHGVAMLIKRPHQYIQIPIQMNIPVRKDTQSSE